MLILIIALIAFVVLSIIAFIGEVVVTWRILVGKFLLSISIFLFVLSFLASLAAMKGDFRTASFRVNSSDDTLALLIDSEWDWDKVNEIESYDIEEIDLLSFLGISDVDDLSLVLPFVNFFMKVGNRIFLYILSGIFFIASAVLIIWGVVKSIIDAVKFKKLNSEKCYEKMSFKSAPIQKYSSSMNAPLNASSAQNSNQQQGSPNSSDSSASQGEGTQLFTV